MKAIVCAALSTAMIAGAAYAEVSGPIVRIAELEIEAAQLERFKAAVTEGMEAAVRVEPGVIALYAVAVKGEPTQLRVIEIYANEQAYLSHRETPHFRKYLAATQGMVKTRNLIETDNLLLRDKTTFASDHHAVIE